MADMTVINNTKKEAAQFDQDFNNLFNESTTNIRNEEMDNFFKTEEKQPIQDPNAPVSQSQTTDENGNIIDTVKAVAGQVGDVAGAIGSDIVQGGRQAPRRIGRGAVKAVNSMLGLLDGVSDYMPAVSFQNDQGDLSMPSIVTAKTDKQRISAGVNKKLDAEAAKTGIKPDYVDLDKPMHLPNLSPAADKSVTGDMVEGISQFVTGLGAVGKLSKLAGGTKVGQFLQSSGAGSSIAKGALADILAFDEHEQRLSNVIQRVPALQNPVTEFLQSKPDDTFLEGKLKQAIEGTIGNTLGEALFRGIKFVKKFKPAADEMKAQGLTPDDLLTKNLDDAAGVKLSNTEYSPLGDADNAELILREAPPAQMVDDTIDPAAAKIAKATKETAGITPGQVGDPNAAKGADTIKINFARIEGEEDVRKVMDQLVNDATLQGSVNDARRGVQTMEATLKGAEDIDGFNELLSRRTGDAFNDQQIVASRKVYYDTTNKLLEMAEKAAGPTATDLDQFMFRKMIAIHHAVQKEVMGARAEAGRALRAWSIPLSGTDGNKVKGIEELLNDFGGAVATKDLAKRMTTMSKAGGLTTDQINVLANGGALARTGKALINVWQMGLLTSPRTHIVNVTSNTLTGLLLGAEKMSASLMGDTPITAREGLEYYIGYIGSMKEALANAAKAFKTGETGFGLGKIDLPPINPASREILDPEGKAGIFSKALASYGEILNRVVGGGLAAGDEFAKTTLFRGQMRALATRQGISQGLDGVELKKFIADALTDPDAYMKSDAMEFASYGTYTNALEGGGAAVQKFVAKVPAARIIVPFVRTPINIFKFTFSRTPLGLLSQKMRNDLQAGGLQRSQALAKLGTGTSVMMLGTDMSLEGHITGAGPSNPEERARLRNTGWRPYSIKVDDKYYSYARFDPFATWLGMSADMTEILTNYEAYDVKAQDEIDELVTAGVAAISNQVVGKTFMQGVADMTQVLSDSKRYGGQWLNKMAGSLVPAAVADIERAVSPEVEQVFNMIDAIKARIPGLSETVNKRYNVYGEVIKNYIPGEDWGGVPERLQTMINPVQRSAVDQDQKLDQWFLANGVDGPNMPQKTQTFEDPRSFGKVRIAIDLREYPEIYGRFNQLRGEMKLPQYQNMTMKKYLTGLVDKRVPGSSVFFNQFATDKDRQGTIIAGIVADYDKAIRKQLVNEYPVLQQHIIEENEKQKALDANAGGQGLIRKKSFP